MPISQKAGVAIAAFNDNPSEPETCLCILCSVAVAEGSGSMPSGWRPISAGFVRSTKRASGISTATVTTARMR